ncbi:uncharacterized protein [Primulina eburnea]|uniref:uncharacterized protein n=1 Tax=Primulina eburnea TaxID=1245227 RepID=UPI003C6CB38D
MSDTGDSSLSPFSVEARKAELEDEVFYESLHYWERLQELELLYNSGEATTPELVAELNQVRKHLNIAVIIDIGDVQCVVNLRINRNAFVRLCYLLTHVGRLVESRYVRIEDKVSMFLSVLAYHKKNRVIGHDYVRSGHTINTHFHQVLQSILMLHPLLLVKPSSVDDSGTNETWKWFKGCLGALDGTYVSVHVPTMDKARYRTRKCTIAVNVLGVCGREMKFIYALTGWEGSAADDRVLKDAVTRDDTLKIPRGCYYLCYNVYANVDGFLTPYRRVCYHRDAWGNRANGPQNYKELFN